MIMNFGSRESGTHLADDAKVGHGITDAQIGVNGLCLFANRRLLDGEV